MQIEQDFSVFDVVSLGIIVSELMTGTDLPKNVKY